MFYYKSHIFYYLYQQYTLQSFIYIFLIVYFCLKYHFLAALNKVIILFLSNYIYISINISLNLMFINHHMSAFYFSIILYFIILIKQFLFQAFFFIFLFTIYEIKLKIDFDFYHYCFLLNRKIYLYVDFHYLIKFCLFQIDLIYLAFKFQQFLAYF